MQQLIIGRYIPGDSLIHQLDPRTKLLIVFLYVFVVFLANNAISYGFLFLYALIALFFAKVPIRYVLSGLKPILWIFLFTFFLHIFTNKEGEVLFQLGWFSIHEKGLEQGIYISIRFFVIILMTTLLTLTTTPIEITDGLETLLKPLKRIKVPVHEIALMMSISLRFIPTLMDETSKIMKAQSSRGIDFAGGPIKDRMKAIISLLVPLFISAFKRAEDLAIAMEARGYQSGEGRTKFRQLRWKTSDTVTIISLLCLACILAWVRS
ncbi:MULTISPECIES: energy-coupling factor transporter transmembrane component T family protein [Bacillus]|uniref:Energy-coupling factor transporter transmembrane protein EcfT n=2 Tax=Bacillus cereus group TaxID=86661 RepID=A0A164PAG8_BACCE|nr:MULTISPECIES: energy-coupling factor transporter transmembrane protein EcfT [Bacillus]KXY80555.1 cobalt ABC transporter permease [Bacillus wiedmannii]KZD66560.1 Transmembrane component of ral energizing module of ECF transporter [Bacillus cereus]MDG1619460.1 energy-coupling factor transporter transmembrane protein EcfT [Bacillus mobilis]MDX5840003.1 energy-coupling factor transporter transmembrane protein EcfT [Bacillus cereus group sp. BfR-BA-01700]MED4388234.1 energy-coupling factor trans